MDTYDFLADPRTLTLAERQETCDQNELAQAVWHHKLQLLAEGPKPGPDFPAFLLATAPFADLAHKIEKAQTRNQLPVDVADELDWFLRAFADYLRTDNDEEVFPAIDRVAI